MRSSSAVLLVAGDVVVQHFLVRGSELVSVSAPHLESDAARARESSDSCPLSSALEHRRKNPLLSRSMRVLVLAMLDVIAPASAALAHGDCLAQHLLSQGFSRLIQ